MIRAWIAVIFLFLCSCTHSQYRSPGPYSGGPLMGMGTYLQDVSIEPGKGATFRFQGVFQRRKEGATISGLSPFGTTVFRVTDDFQGEAKIEIFVDELKAHEDRVLDFYRAVRPLLLFNDNPAVKNGFVLDRFPDGRPKKLSGPNGVDLSIEAYDDQGRVEKLLIHNAHFDGKITLREFVQ